MKTVKETAESNGIEPYTTSNSCPGVYYWNQVEDIAETYASQFKPKWIYTEPETDGTYLIAFKFGVTEGKFWHGKYLTSDFSRELPAAYAYMAMPDKPEPPKTV